MVLDNVSEKVDDGDDDDDDNEMKQRHCDELVNRLPIRKKEKKVPNANHYLNGGQHKHLSSRDLDDGVDDSAVHYHSPRVFMSI